MTDCMWGFVCLRARADVNVSPLPCDTDTWSRLFSVIQYSAVTFVCHRVFLATQWSSSQSDECNTKTRGQGTAGETFCYTTPCQAIWTAQSLLFFCHKTVGQRCILAGRLRILPMQNLLCVFPCVSVLHVANNKILFNFIIDKGTKSTHTHTD